MRKYSNLCYPHLEEYFEKLDVSTIMEERKSVLQPLILAIKEKVEAQEAVRLNFICTHNSRRSHLSQVWAQTFACYFGIPGVVCYSGGTEATAVYPMIIETLLNTGFLVQELAGSENPLYSFKFGANELPIMGFSKAFDHPFNPQSDFIAIMTCSQADEGCPFIPGASRRIPITYDDPKEFDGTALQAGKYKERSEQIATEMYYVFSQIKSS